MSFTLKNVSFAMQGQPATPHSTSSSEHAASPGVQQQSPKLMKQTDDNSPINSV